MTQYDPDDPKSRAKLAEMIIESLVVSGFDTVEPDYFPNNHREYAMFRQLKPDLRLVVWTSIEGSEIRHKESNDMRVIGSYRSERTSYVRIVTDLDLSFNYEGSCEDIVDRMLNTILKLGEMAENPLSCGVCGAPCFTSKKGNICCGDLCWIN